jgi:ABC-2 type transport system permease protein
MRIVSPAPGSTLWLAAHHVRLSLRAMTRGVERWNRLGLIAAALFYALCVWGVGAPLADLMADPAAVADLGPTAGALTLLVTVTGLAVGVMSAFQTSTDRGDLDLLLSAPMPPVAIVRARLLATAWRSTTIYWLMAGLFTLHAIVTGAFALLWTFPVLAALGWMHATLSHAAASALMRRLGLSRGRVASQVAGSLGLAVAVTGWQIVRGLDLSAFSTTPVGQALVWLGGAFLGQWAPACALILASVALGERAARHVGRRFAEDAARLSGQTEAGGRKRKDPARARAAMIARVGAGPFVAVMGKEWRNLRRDPLIMVQVAVPVVTLLLPLTLGRLAGVIDLPADLAHAFTAGFAVMFAAQTAGSIAWLAASVEEAGDLIAGAPVPARTVVAAKIATVAALAGGLVTMGAALVIATGGGMGVVATTVLFGLVGAASTAQVEFSRPRPARRVKLTERPDRSVLSVTLGAGLSMTWALAAGLAAFGTIWWLAPALFALAMAGVTRVTGRRTAKVRRADARGRPSRN